MLFSRKERVNIPRLQDVHQVKIIMNNTRKQLFIPKVKISPWSEIAYVWISWEFPPEIQMSIMWLFFDKSTREDHWGCLMLHSNGLQIYNTQNGPETLKGYFHHKIFTSNKAPWQCNWRWTDSYYLLLPLCLSPKITTSSCVKIKKENSSYAELTWVPSS